MTLLWSFFNAFLAWSRPANPFRPAQRRATRRLRPEVETEPESSSKTARLDLPQAVADRLWRLLTLWHWLVLLLAGMTVLGMVYGVGELRHEQELRISSRRVRQAEARLRDTEIRLQRIYRDNQELRAQWAMYQASETIARIRMAQDNPLLLVQDHASGPARISN